MLRHVAIDVAVRAALPASTLLRVPESPSDGVIVCIILDPKWSPDPDGTIPQSKRRNLIYRFVS
jgi:hypothetical protein